MKSTFIILALVSSDAISQNRYIEALICPTGKLRVRLGAYLLRVRPSSIVSATSQQLLTPKGVNNEEFLIQKMNFFFVMSVADSFNLTKVLMKVLNLMNDINGGHQRDWSF
jgi:hypothetical protein